MPHAKRSKLFQTSHIVVAAGRRLGCALQPFPAAVDVVEFI